MPASPTQPWSIYLPKRLWPALAALLLAAFIFTTWCGIALAPQLHQPLGLMSQVRIVVDPGHGGMDGGCSWNGILEKDLNLALGLALAEELKQYKAQVKLTRTTDEALVPWGAGGGSRHKRDLAARLDIARRYEAQLYIALHVNSGPSHLGGSLTFYRQDNEESRKLAAAVQERLSKLVPGNQNGILPARYMVLTGLDIPSILIETGFLTNEVDRRFLTGAEAPSLLAAGIAAGVAAYLKGEVPSSPTLSSYQPPCDGDITSDLHKDIACY